MNTFPFWFHIPHPYSKAAWVFTGYLSCYRGPNLSVSIFSQFYSSMWQSPQATKKIQWNLVVILKISAHKPWCLFFFASPAMISIRTWRTIHCLHRFVYVFPQTKKIIKRCIHLLTRNINKSFWISLKESWAFRLTKHKKGKLTC